MNIYEIKENINNAISIINKLYNSIFQLSQEKILNHLIAIESIIKQFNDTNLTKEFDTLVSVAVEGGTGNTRKQLESFKARLAEFIKKKEEEIPLDYHAIYRLYLNKKISAFECANKIDQAYNKILGIKYKKGITHKVMTGNGELNVPELKGEFDHDFIEDTDLVAIAEAWFAYFNNPRGESIKLEGSKGFSTKHGAGLREVLRMAQTKFSGEIAYFLKHPR